MFTNAAAAQPGCRSASLRGLRGPHRQPGCTSSVLANTAYVNDKAGGPLDFRRELGRLARDGFELAPVTSEDVLLFDRLSKVPEMHDRLIAALATRRGAAVVSRDRMLSESAGVPVVW